MRRCKGHTTVLSRGVTGRGMRKSERRSAEGGSGKKARSWIMVKGDGRKRCFTTTTTMANQLPTLVTIESKVPRKANETHT